MFHTNFFTHVKRIEVRKHSVIYKAFVLYRRYGYKVYSLIVITFEHWLEFVRCWVIAIQQVLVRQLERKREKFSRITTYPSHHLKQVGAALLFVGPRKIMHAVNTYGFLLCPQVSRDDYINRLSSRKRYRLHIGSKFQNGSLTNVFVQRQSTEM
jgi:hypothetical protein